MNKNRDIKNPSDVVKPLILIDIKIIVSFQILSLKYGYNTIYTYILRWKIPTEMSI